MGRKRNRNKTFGKTVRSAELPGLFAVTDWLGYAIHDGSEAKNTFGGTVAFYYSRTEKVDVRDHAHKDMSDCHSLKQTFRVAYLLTMKPRQKLERKTEES